MSYAAAAARPVRVLGQVVEIEVAPEREAEADDEGRDDDPDAPPHQHAPPAAREEDTGCAEDEDEDRQHPPQRVEQAHGRLRALQAARVDELELQPSGVDGHVVEDGDATVVELAAYTVDERREVEDDLALFRRDELTAAGERLVDLRVREPVDLFPQRTEAIRLQEVEDRVLGEVLQRVGQRTGEEGDPTRQFLLGQGLDVDVLEERVRETHRNGLEDLLVLGERRDGVHVAVGVEQIVVQPQRHHRDRCQHAAEHDENDRQDAPPPRYPVRRRAVAGTGASVVLTRASSHSGPPQRAMTQRAMRTSAICTPLSAAPLRRLSPVIQRLSEPGSDGSSRTRPTSTGSMPAASSGVGIAVAVVDEPRHRARRAAARPLRPCAIGRWKRTFTRHRVADEHRARARR